MLALVAALVLGGFGLLLVGPVSVAAQSGTLTLYDSDCSSGTIPQTTFQGYLDTYSEIDYYGSTPCTINLTSSLNISGGITQTIDGEYAGFIFTGDAVPSTNTPGTFAIFSINDSQNSSTLALRFVTIENGSVGIYGANSTIDLDKSTVSGNGLGDVYGDGIHALNVNLTNSTVTNNAYGVDAFNNLTIANSTIANNSYDGVEADVNGTTTITSSTISGNELGLYTFNPTTVTATILANDEDCDIRGTFTDGGYNLSTSPTCIGGNTSWPVASASELNLLPLGDYAGPTDTEALGPGSVAIGAIPAATCETYTYPVDTFYSSGAIITTDQRGTDRPQGATCDVGAYEAPSIAVTTTPSSPDATTGWFNASTLSAYSDQVTVTLTANGMAGDEWVRCGDTLVAYGLGGLNESYTFDPATVGAGGDYPDGSYAINGSSLGCEIEQSPTTAPGTPLGFSIDGLSSINVDTVAPAITSPVDGTNYTIGSAVPLTCADATSGIATCQVTVTPPSGSPVVVGQDQNLPTSQFGVYTVTPNTVSDNAGNQDTTALSYTVTGYETVALPGNTTNVRQGYFALIRITFSNGSSYVAGRNLPLTSTSLVGPAGPNAQTIPFVHAFQFGTFGRTPGYQLQINTRNLAKGVWTLNFHLGGAHPQDGQLTFTVY